MTVSATTAIGGVSRVPSYYRARYYNPTTGRFLSEDPMGFAGSGTNLYAYARNNPISNRDPLGLCSCNGGNSDLETVVGGLGGLQEYLEYAAVMNVILPFMFLFSGFASWMGGWMLIFPELFMLGEFFGGPLVILAGFELLLLGIALAAIGIGFALNPPGPRLKPSECQ
jgi:hypothetical protein